MLPRRLRLASLGLDGGAAKTNPLTTKPMKPKPLTTNLWEPRGSRISRGKHEGSETEEKGGLDCAHGVGPPVLARGLAERRRWAVPVA